MRTFGRELTEYFEFQLEGDDKTYRIPLAAAMPFGVLNKIQKASKTEDSLAIQVEMLRKYMGDIVDELPVGVISGILQAWVEESAKAGASVGES